MVKSVIAVKAPVVRGRHASPQELALVLEFLEEPKNFKLLVGNAATGQSVKAGLTLKKTYGFRLLADFVNERLGDPSREWDVPHAKSIYESFLGRYKKVVKFSSPAYTGEGVNADDIAKGITTIAEKQDSMFPAGFARMDALFGFRQNICPSVIVQLGIVARDDQGERDAEFADGGDLMNDKEEDVTPVDGFASGIGASSATGVPLVDTGASMAIGAIDASRAGALKVGDDDSDSADNQHEVNTAFTSASKTKAYFEEDDDSSSSEPEELVKATAKDLATAEKKAKLKEKRAAKALERSAKKAATEAKVMTVFKKTSVHVRPHPPSSQKLSLAQAYMESQTNSLLLEVNRDKAAEKRDIATEKRDKARDKAKFISDLSAQNKTVDQIKALLELAYPAEEQE